MLAKGDLLLRDDYSTSSIWLVVEVSSSEGVFLRGPSGSEDHLGPAWVEKPPPGWRLIDRANLTQVLEDLTKGSAPVVTSELVFSKRLERSVS